MLSCIVIYVHFDSPDSLAMTSEGNTELSAEFSKYQLDKIDCILASHVVI